MVALLDDQRLCRGRLVVFAINFEKGQVSRRWTLNFRHNLHNKATVCLATSKMCIARWHGTEICRAQAGLGEYLAGARIWRLRERYSQLTVLHYRPGVRQYLLAQ